MRRMFGLILLAFGIVGVMGSAGLVILLITKPPARGGPEPYIGITVALVISVGMVLSAIALLRRSRPIGETAGSSAPDITGNFPAKVPQPGELDGTPYTSLYHPPVPGKHPQPSVLAIKTVIPVTGEFRMTRETWFDKMCKNARIATEIQTEDEAFDAECYIRSDTPDFTVAYLKDPLKRVAILDLRRQGFPEVVLKNGELSATWVGFDPHKNGHSELTADVAARLLVLSRNLPEHEPEFDNRVGMHRKQWQMVLWIALALFGATIFSLISFPVMSPLQLFLRAGVVFFVAAPVFAYISAWLLSGTSTSHNAWGSLMVGALFLFPIGSVGIIGLLNGALDESDAVVHNANITEKYTSRSKNKTNYHVRCESWANPGDTESFRVSSSEYQGIVPHQSHMAVTTHEGWLGLEWMKSKRVQMGRAKP